jgi:hypothetical protein
MDIVLGLSGKPTLTPHEASGLILLLRSLGTPVALSVASKLDEQAAATPARRQNVMLTREEKRVLLEALTELGETIPERLAILRSELAADLRN